MVEVQMKDPSEKRGRLNEIVLTLEYGYWFEKLGENTYILWGYFFFLWDIVIVCYSRNWSVSNLEGDEPQSWENLYI